jgi:DNA invertase Pin-like site-specific DNA recombinase
MKRSVHGQYVALYARVSTEDQAREGVSLEAQVARLRAYGEAMRPGEEVRVVIEQGVSAKSLDRPALAELLADCKAKRVSTIVCLKLDRLTRSVRDLADLLDLFEKCGVALCSLSESLDTSTASGRLMLNLLASVSQWEREAIAERTSFALAHKRRSGVVYGPTPFGYCRVGNELVRDNEKYAVLQKIREMRADGQSLRRIVAWLNENGIKTPRGSSKWFVNTLHQVLTSKAALESDAA